jgi:hypothetical protein
MMFRMWREAMWVMWAISATHGLPAAVLFDNFGPNDSYTGQTGIGTGCTGCSIFAGTRFTATGSGQLTGVTSVWWGDDTDMFRVELRRSDAMNHLPGDVMESWSVDLPDFPIGVTVLPSMQQPGIVAGQDYWLFIVSTTMDFNAAVGWATREPGVVNGFFYGPNTGQLSFSLAFGDPVLRLEGTAVPEPGSGLFIILATLPAVVLKRELLRNGCTKAPKGVAPE